MPLDVSAQVASLKNDYGANRGPNSPANFQLAVYTGDPTAGGTEMPNVTESLDSGGNPISVANGYARATVANDGTNFPAPDPTSGVLTSGIITLPMSSFAWPTEGKYWVLYDGTVRWDYGEIPRDQWLFVPQDGIVPKLTLAIFYRGGL